MNFLFSPRKIEIKINMTKGNAHELIFAEGIRERRKQAKKDGDGRVSVVSVLEGAKAPGTVECYKAKVRKLERIMRKANGLSDDENITIDKEISSPSS